MTACVCYTSLTHKGESMKKVGVAILGLGVVGGGTYNILTEKKEFFKRTQGLDITVESV